MNPQLSQQELAAWIDREGLAFEVLEWVANGAEAFWRFPSDDLDALYYLEAGYEIRLAPGALNEWNRAERGMLNPDAMLAARDGKEGA